MKLEHLNGILSGKRIYTEKKRNLSIENRSPFDMDHDRVIYSHFFRRMHDKTQVFPYSPLSNSGQARSRLSHSLEVSCVGRSLGKLFGMYIRDEGFSINPNDVGTIIATACLAHDIGNPPFGHSGEDAIRAWAKNNLTKTLTNDQERNDLLDFEGNAQGFRVLTRLDNPHRYGGMRPTRALITAYSKYTANSLQTSRSNTTSSYRKIGYFKEDEDLFLQIYNDSNLMQNNHPKRSPLAFLSEAADDICYAVIDVEDAFHLGLLDYKTVEELINPIAKIDFNLPENTDHEPISKISKMRSRAINNLIDEVFEVFLSNLKEIFQGHFKNTLISQINSSKEYDNIVSFSRKHIYTTSRVIEIECAGFKAIGGLLDIFIKSVLRDNPDKEDKLNLLLIPKANFYRYEKNNFHEEIEEVIAPLSKYERILSVTDFISGMTDRYAIELYQRISGIKLPVY